MLSVVTFGVMMMLRMSSSRIVVAAVVLVGLYALLDSYKNGSAAVSKDGSLIGVNVVCIDNVSYKITGAGLTDSGESLIGLRGTNGSVVPCIKKSEFK